MVLADGDKGGLMKRGKRLVVIGIGLALIVFGAGCMNYTKASTLEHHRAWAREHGMPEPSRGMFFGGMGSAGVGVLLVGVGVIGGRRPSGEKVGQESG